MAIRGQINDATKMANLCDFMCPDADNDQLM